MNLKEVVTWLILLVFFHYNINLLFFYIFYYTRKYIHFQETIIIFSKYQQLIPIFYR